MPTRILYETHMHTPLCKHAVGEPEEYAQVALERNLKGMIVTCHNPLPDRFSHPVRMSPDQFDEYLMMVDRARRAYSGEVDVRLGMECDFFPGFEDFLQEQIASQPFHYILGSVHPQIKEYKEAYWRDDATAFFKQYYKHLAEAAKTGLFDCLSHPDIVKNVAPSQWILDDVMIQVMEEVCSTLDVVAKTGMAMELNTSGVNKSISEMNPGVPILKRMHECNIPIVVGADAHKPERVGDGYLDAYDILESVGYTHVNFFLNREMQSVSIEDARKSLTLDPTD